jgi:hypothetical protein
MNAPHCYVVRTLSLLLWIYQCLGVIYCLHLTLKKEACSSETSLNYCQTTQQQRACYVCFDRLGHLCFIQVRVLCGVKVAVCNRPTTYRKDCPFTGYEGTWGSGGTAPLFLTLGSQPIWRRCRLKRRSRRSQSPCGRFEDEKISSSYRHSKHRSSSQKPCHYTDWCPCRHTFTWSILT